MVAKMAVMWSAASFCTYLSQMLNKYLEGTIFINNYLEGFAGIIGNYFAVIIYSRLGVRGAFLASMGITLAGASLIYLFEAGILDPSIAVNMGLTSKSLDPKGSLEANEQYLSALIPIFGFITKIGNNISFLNCYQASFSNETVFPILRRATATGICNFVARTLTICAPMAAELERPAPVKYLCIVAFIAWTVALSLPSHDSEMQAQL